MQAAGSTGASLLAQSWSTPFKQLGDTATLQAAADCRHASAATAAAAARSWSPPTCLLALLPLQAPPDLIRTVAYGTLLFDSSSSDVELGTTYRPIEDAFNEAIQYIRSNGQ